MRKHSRTDDGTGIQVLRYGGHQGIFENSSNSCEDRSGGEGTLGGRDRIDERKGGGLRIGLRGGEKRKKKNLEKPRKKQHEKEKAQRL